MKALSALRFLVIKGQMQNFVIHLAVTDTIKIHIKWIEHIKAQSQ